MAGRIEAVDGASAYGVTRASTTRSWFPRPRFATATTRWPCTRCCAAGPFASSRGPDDLYISARARTGRVAAALAALLVTSCAGGGDGRAAPPDKPPVIVLILDEFPLDTLLRPDGSIDAERYPNFADLAERSTWFPNAFTIYDSTFKAVPAIMDSVLPRKGTAADFHSHPRSVYHLFDGLGYEVVDVESGEALCPPRICPAARTTRPGVLKRLAGGGRPARLHAWIGAIRRARGGRPSISSMPYCRTSPGSTCPSGHQSGPTGNDPIPAINGPVGFHDPALTNHNETRHLLQVGFVDHQVGLLLARLRQTGLLDRR